jgi:heterodisulfide reductase subunit B
MEDFIRALGAEPVIYSMRNECCGGYTALKDPDFTKQRTAQIFDDSTGFGADCLITACPLCMFNLNKSDAKSKVPVYYFTELLAEALGVKEGA